MSALFEFTTQAIEDLDDNWWFVAEESVEAAERVETEIVETCRNLAVYLRIGHSRLDITPLPVRFWTLPRFPNYTVVYRPAAKLQVLAILHGKQDPKQILRDRPP